MAGEFDTSSLVKFDLPKRKETSLVEDVVEMQLSADRMTVALLKDEDGALSVSSHAPRHAPNSRAHARTRARSHRLYLRCLAASPSAGATAF